VQAALDLPFLQTNNIKTGKYRQIKSLLPPKTWIRSATSWTSRTSCTRSSTLKTRTSLIFSNRSIN
jgi:hypothetical protein